MPHLTRSNLFWFLILGCFWKEKNSKTFSLYAFTAELGVFMQKMENVVKISLTIISNDTCFKLFTLNQVIEEVNC